jgi:hypothetical protein
VSHSIVRFFFEGWLGVISGSIRALGTPKAMTRRGVKPGGLMLVMLYYYYLLAVKPAAPKGQNDKKSTVKQLFASPGPVHR